MRRIIVMSPVIALVLAACAVGPMVPMAPESMDLEAKRFAAAPDRANIYVVRTPGMSSVVFRLSIDGRLVGSIAPGTCHLASVTPGEHTVAAFSQESQELVKLATEAGKNYFVEVSLRRRVGFWATTWYVRVTQASDEEGRQMVQESRGAERTR